MLRGGGHTKIGLNKEIPKVSKNNKHQMEYVSVIHVHVAGKKKRDYTVTREVKRTVNTNTHSIYHQVYVFLTKRLREKERNTCSRRK